MLPEQILRGEHKAAKRFTQLESAILDVPPNLVAEVVRLAKRERRRRNLFAIARINQRLDRRYPKPHTLTGDAWRTAWAEAHDAATDAALDAVY